MTPEPNLTEIQRRLLETPDDHSLWLALQQKANPLPASAKGEQQASAPAPVQPVAAEPAAAPATPKSSTGAFQDLNIRPLKLKFHQEKSPEGESLLQKQLSQLKALAEHTLYEDVLNRIGNELAEPLAAVLRASTAYGMGRVAYEKERFDMAAVFLQRVMDDEGQGDLLPWADLFLGLSYRGLGQISEAVCRLENLLTQHPVAAAAAHADVALAWLDLNRGEPARVTQRVERLRSHPLAAELSNELDLLGRVVSTLEWLCSNSHEQLSHAVDMANSDGVVAALDRLRLSSCGRVFMLEGWIVDPSKQLREVCIVRGNRAWRINLGHARYSSRPDLQEIITRCGGSNDLHPGLRLASIALPGEAFPLKAGEQAAIFMVLANGTQFCLGRTLERIDISTKEIKSLLDLAIREACQLESANLLFRARTLWSDELQEKLQRSAETRLFGEEINEPELSVIIPLYGRVDFMEYQLNWFNAWQRRKGHNHVRLQLIYVLDDPRIKQECLALAKRCNTLYAVPFELILNGDNLGFAGANNRGFSHAKAPLLLLLNSDVLPADDYSLERMLRAMQQHSKQIGALGARLLFDNGAIQHQGMSFVQESDLDGELGRVWLNEHPLKGVKVKLDPDIRVALEEMEAVTAACMMVDRDLFAKVGGFGNEYIIGDFEDSDLCLKLRSEGLPIMLDYTANFYHLERQSVDLASESDQMKAKLVTANAVTHHQKWCSSIERLHCSMINP